MNKSRKEISLTISEFVELLKRNGIKDLNPEVERNLYNFFINRGIEFREARDFLIGAKRKERLTADWVNRDENSNEEGVKISFADAKKQALKEREIAHTKLMLGKLVRENSDIDDRILYSRLAEIDAKFKEVYKSRKEYKIPRLDITIKSVYEAVKRHSDQKNEDVNLFLDSEIEKLYDIACVYAVLVKHFKENPEVDERVADKVIAEKFATLISNNPKIPVDKELGARVDKFLTSLSEVSENLPEEEVFSAEELRALIKKVPSLLYATDEAKSTGVRKVLREYLDELSARAEDENAKAYLSQTSAKKIVLNVGSLLEQDAECLDEATSFMLGKSASEVLRSKQELGRGIRDAKKAEFAKNFAGLKIEGFTVEKQLYIIKNNASVLPSINLLNIMNSNNEVLDILAEGFDLDTGLNQAQKIQALREIGIEPEKLIHADNVVDLLQYGRARVGSDKRPLAISNIKTLKKIMPPQDLQKIVKHNYAFLCQDPEWVEEKLTEIYIKHQKDYKGLKEEMEGLVNSFYRYQDPKSATKGSVTEQAGQTRGQRDAFKFDNDKDYIDLNLFAFGGMEDADKIKTKKSVKEELSRENYREKLYFELAELKKYLDAKQENKIARPEPNTIARHLSDYNMGRDDDFTKGALKRRIKNLTTMLTYLIEDENKPVGIEDSLTSLMASIDLRLSRLGLTIAESESLGDTLALDFKTRVEASKENEGSYTSYIEMIDEKIKNLKNSPKLKNELGEDKAKYQLLLDALVEEREKIAQNKQWMTNLYEERNNCKNESKALQTLFALFGATEDELRSQKNLAGENFVDEEMKNKNSVAIQIKAREIECLEAVIEDNQTRFNETYLKEKDKEGSHAKKWAKKIEENERKLERLKKELQQMLEPEKL